MGNIEVILKVNRRGFKCETCQNHFSETWEFVGINKNYIAFLRKMRYGVTDLNEVKNIEPENVMQL